MKNSLKVFILMALALVTLKNNLSGQTLARVCSHANEISHDDYIQIAVDSSTAWLNFEASSEELYLFLMNVNNNASYKIRKVELFSGNCSSLGRILVDSLSNSNDSTLYLETTSLTENTTYYLKLTKATNSSNQSNVIGMIASNQSATCKFGTRWDHINGNLHTTEFIGNGNNSTYSICDLSLWNLTVGAFFPAGLNGPLSNPINSVQVNVYTNGSPSSYTLNSGPNYTLNVPFSATAGATPVNYTVCMFDDFSQTDCACFTFTILPKPTPQFSISPSQICVGSTLCVTPSYTAGTHTWTMQNTPNNFTSSSTNTCFPVTSGNYTIGHTAFNTGTSPGPDACQSSTTITGSITPVQASFIYTTGCSNTGTFTASSVCGGSSPLYTWYFGNNALGIFTNSPIYAHTFSSAGTHTVTLVVINGTYSSSITQTVFIPGTASVSLNGSASLCGTLTTANFYATANQSVTAVTWAATNATISSTAFIYAVSISFANTSTTNVVTATVVTVNGCTNVVTYSIQPCCATPSEGYVLNNYVGPPGPHTGGIIITNTFTIPANSVLHLDNAEVYMSPGSRINVPSTATLLVTESYLHGCNYMWDGIYLYNGGTVKFEEVYVADAQRVIIDSVGTNQIDLYDFIFFRNYKGLVLKSAATATNISVESGIFTSGTVPVAFPMTLAYTSSATIGGYTKSVLLPPYTSNFSLHGIELLMAKSSNTVSGLDYRIPFKKLLFDKLTWGAYLRGSHTSITQSIFQNAAPPTGFKYKPLNKTGGIYVGNPICEDCDWYSYPVNDLAVGGNNPRQCLFLENNYGILTEAPCRITIDQNDFNKHCYGIYIGDNWTGEEVSVLTNTFNANGYYANYPATAVALINNFVVNANVSDNTISNSSAYGTHASNYGIYCSEVTQLAGANYTLSNNSISLLYNGIFLGNTQNSKVQNNSIDIRPTFSGVFNFQQGIQASQCYAPDIYDNAISSPTNNSSHGYDWAVHQHGILLDNSSLASVRCNSINDLPVSMKAQGQCFTPIGDGYRGNSTTDANLGFWLDNSGEVGDQYYLAIGSNTLYSADNEWHNHTLNTLSSAFSNLSPSAFNLLPRIYSRSNSPYQIPNNSVSQNLGANPVYGTNNSSNVGNVCNAPNRPFLQHAAYSIANGDLNFDENEDLIKLGKRALYRNLLLENIATDTSEVFEDFLNLESGNSNGMYYNIEAKLQSVFTGTSQSQRMGRFNEAVGMLISAPLEDSQDENQRTVIAMAMGRIASGLEFDSLDIVRLENIAEQCPMADGMAVLQARTLLWPLTGLKYKNDCELAGWDYEAGMRRANIPKETEAQLSTKVNALVYPNPANESIFIELMHAETALIEIMDVSGRICGTKTIDAMDKMDISELANGLYIYKISNRAGLIKAGSIIIYR